MTTRSMPGPGDEALVAVLQAGDELAFESWVRTEGPRLHRAARRFLRNDEDARDVVQEAFLSAFRAIKRFEGGSRLSTWLYRIMVNAALMKLRTQRRRPETSMEELLPRFLADGHQADPAVSWAERSDDALARKELCGFVRQCIDRLPDSYRTVLLLRDIEEVDTKEAAQALGVSENALKIRLHRARQALRGLLDQRLRGVSA